MSSTPELEPPAKKPRAATDDVHYLQGQQKVYSEAEVCTATSTGLSSWETGEEAAERVHSRLCACYRTVSSAAWSFTKRCKTAVYLR